MGILGWVNSAWVWTFSQILEGVAFCFLYIGAIKTINDIIPKTYQATGQSLFSFSCYGFGGIVGSYLSGLVVHSYNVFVLYKIVAIICLTTFIGVFGLSKVTLNRQTTNIDLKQ